MTFAQLLHKVLDHYLGDEAFARRERRQIEGSRERLWEEVYEEVFDEAFEAAWTDVPENSEGECRTTSGKGSGSASWTDDRQYEEMMTRPLEPMLARWPMPYPEVAGADVENDSSIEAAKVRREVVALLLEATDIHRAFEETVVEYGRWRDLTLAGEGDTKVVLAHENRLDDTLEAAFEEHRQTPGGQSVGPLRQTVMLRRIAGGSISHRESWLEEA